VLDDGSTQLQQFQYNTIGKPTQAIDPIGRTTLITYNATNYVDLLTVSQVANGATNALRQLTYNSQHLPLTAVDAAGQTTFFGYNTNGQLVAATNALNQVVTLAYNTNGYFTNITGALPGTTTGFTYDDYGRVNTITDSEGYTITYSYDLLDRPTQVSYPDGTYQQIVYTNLDPVESRDRLGHWSTAIYNAQRQLTEISDALGRVTSFQRCSCGALESITDPLGRTTTFLRDVEKRLTTKIYPDGTQLNYTYENATSRLSSVTDARNQTASYSYFVDNNLAEVAYANAEILPPPVFFTYDTNYNRLLTMTDGIGTTAYAYYPMTNGQLGAGRLSSVTSPLPNSAVTYNYDPLGRITNRAINGVCQQLTFDALGRLNMETNALGAFTNTYVDSTARVSTNFYPNGQKTVFSYYGTTNSERLQQIQNLTSNGQNLSTFAYAYDAEGDITNWSQQTDANVPTMQVLQYDPVKQLLSSTVYSNTIAGTMLQQFIYAYDQVANRTGSLVQSGSTNAPAVSSATYNNVNQRVSSTGTNGPILLAGSVNQVGTVTISGSPAMMSTPTNFSGFANVGLGTNVVQVVATNYSGFATTNNYQIVVTNNGVPETFSYDANGNETSMVTATSTNAYQWDAANRLVSISGPTNQSVFLYDGLGRRVGITEYQNGAAVSTNTYLWCGAELCEKRDSLGGTVIKRFFQEGEQMSGTNYYFTRDHLGSIREMVDDSGTIQARYNYDPYGQRTKISGSLDADFSYAGYYYHAASGLFLTLFRAYDSSSGRWLNRDPIGEAGGINLYQFVGNNPINLYDSFGLAWYDDTAAYWQNQGAAAKNIVNNSGSVLLATLVNSVIDVGVGVVSAPAVVGNIGTATGTTGQYIDEPVLQPLVNLGSGAGTYSADSSLANAAGLAQDVSTAAGVLALGLNQLPIGNAAIGFKGGEITFTPPGAKTPDLRVNPCGGSGYPPHYHRRPGIGKHRPWEGGF